MKIYNKKGIGVVLMVLLFLPLVPKLLVGLMLGDLLGVPSMDLSNPVNLFLPSYGMELLMVVNQDTESPLDREKTPPVEISEEMTEQQLFLGPGLELAPGPGGQVRPVYKAPTKVNMGDFEFPPVEEGEPK